MDLTTIYHIHIPFKGTLKEGKKYPLPKIAIDSVFRIDLLQKVFGRDIFSFTLKVY